MVGRCNVCYVGVLCVRVVYCMLGQCTNWLGYVKVS